MTAPFDGLDVCDRASEVSANGSRPKSQPAPFSVAAEDVTPEGWNDPVHGNISWRTLISGDRTASAGLVLGIAEMPPDGWLGLHRHAPPEFYLGLSGEGTVTIDGVAHQIVSGTAVYIPGNAEHGIVAGRHGLTFAYGFGVDGFKAIAYHFSAEAQNPSGKVGA